MSKKVGVVLAGCGVMDGSEIYESVVTLLALDRAGAKAICMAPDVPQRDVHDHYRNQPAEGQTRNVLVESGRLARMEVRDIAGVKAGDLDALIFPGGYGAAKNLCDFALKGPDCTVNAEVSRLIDEMADARKPLGFICIAPALAARVFQGKRKVKLTLGQDAGLLGALEKMGSVPVACAATDIVVDQDHKVVSTPAYNVATRISEAATGIEALVKKVLELV